MIPHYPLLMVSQKSRLIPPSSSLNEQKARRILQKNKSSLKQKLVGCGWLEDTVLVLPRDSQSRAKEI